MADFIDVVAARSMIVGESLRRHKRVEEIADVRGLS
jgi:hypothetical protein